MHPPTPEEKKANIAYDQLDELEEDLHGAMAKVEGDQPIMMNPKILKTLVSYLEHLDYLHQHETGETDIGLPPKLPDHFRAEDRIKVDNIPHEVVGEDIEELKGQVQDLTDELNILNAEKITRE